MLLLALINALFLPSAYAVGDTTPPELTEATVNGSTLTLTYDEALDPDSKPAWWDFSVQVTNSTVDVSDVDVSGTTVTLTLVSAAAVGDIVHFVYYGTSASPIQDLAGNKAGAVPFREIPNNTPPPPDTTAPSLVTAVVNGTTLTLTYSETLSFITGLVTTDFAVTVAGDPVAVSNVVVSGTTVTLTLASAAKPGDTVILSCAACDTQIRDLAGNPSGALTDQAVTNNTQDTTAPTLLSATTFFDDQVGQMILTLTYDKNLDPNSIPAAADFTLTVRGERIGAYNYSVNVSGTMVTLTGIAHPALGDLVTLSYTPGANPIRDLASYKAGALTNQVVTVVDPLPPALSWAEVNGTTLYLGYSEKLDSNSVPAKTDYTVTVAGNPVAVSNVAVSDREVTLTLASAVTAGDTVLLSYAVGATAIQDLVPNRADGLNNLEVFNSTWETRDGVGEMIISDGSVATMGETGLDLTFRYTSPTRLDEATVTLDVPAGWTAPTTQEGAPGYVYANGEVSVSGRTIMISYVSLDPGDEEEPADVLKIYYHGVTAPNTPGKTTFVAKERSTESGTLKELATSPEVTVLSPDGSGTLTVSPKNLKPGQTGANLTFTYTAPAGGIFGAVAVTVPTGWTAPTAASNGAPNLDGGALLPGGGGAAFAKSAGVPFCLKSLSPQETSPGPGEVTASTGCVNISGQTFTVFLNLAAGETVTITYSNVTAPTQTGTYRFDAQSAISFDGTLTALAVSPTVTVSSPTPPPPPVVPTPPVATVSISAPVTETREASVTVTGTANPGASVSVGGQTVTADSQGRWSAVVSLTEGRNEIKAVNGTASSSVTILRDSTPPTLTLTASATRTEAESVTLTATSEAGAKITIQGQEGATRTVQLALGSNTFTATATDKLGNQATATVKVERIAPAPAPKPEPKPEPKQEPTPSAPVKVTDIDGHWAEAAILRMVERGVVTGFEDQTFRPQNPVTRAEFAVMLARALKLAPAGEPLSFTDAGTIPAWAQGPVAALVHAGIIHGRADGSFDPEAGVTRDEAAVMLTGALRLLGIQAHPGAATFTDADQIPAWALEATQTVGALRLMVGDQTGAFRPVAATTRAEVAVLLDRLLALR